MQSTPIEWATASWNPTRGCSRVSPGCGGPNGAGGCYAEKIAARFSGPGLAYDGLTTNGRWNGKMRLVEEKLEDPLRRKKPERIFVNSTSDLFHENLTNHEIARVFATMARAHWHTFLILTKRHERLARFFVEQEPPIGYSWPLPNVWLGVSVENQEYADRRIPHLLSTPAAVRFLSVEPMIGPVRLDECSPYVLDGDESNPGVVNAFTAMSWHPKTVKVAPPVEGTAAGVQWCIVGGESGPGARPCDVEWIRAIQAQCAAAGVPCFTKQLGAFVVDRNDAGFEGEEPEHWPIAISRENRVEHLTERNWQGDAVRIRLRDRKGGDWTEWPEALRVRQFPVEVAVA